MAPKKAGTRWCPGREAARRAVAATAGAWPRRRRPPCATGHPPEDGAIDDQVGGWVGAFDQHREPPIRRRREGARSGTSKRAPAATGNVAETSAPSSNSKVTVTSVAAPWLNSATVVVAWRAPPSSASASSQRAAPAVEPLPLTASSSVPLAPHHLVRSTTIGAVASTVMPSVVFESDGCSPRRQSSGDCPPPACRSGSPRPSAR